MTLRPASNYSSASFEPSTRDLRGSRLLFSDSNTEAEVSDLLVDNRGSVRYLIARMDGHYHPLPIGYVRSLPSSNALAARGVSASALERSPDYVPGTTELDDEFETRISSYFDSVDDQERTYAGPDYRGRGWQSGEDRDLELLERLRDYQVSPDSDDARGWAVVNEQGDELGTVDDLVGDTSSMKITHMVVDLNTKLFQRSRHILIPVGYADLVRESQIVSIRGVDLDFLRSLPEFSEEGLHSGSLITETREAFRRRRPEQMYGSPRYHDDAMSTHEDDVRVQRSEEELLVGKRAREGAIAVEKTVDTERVHETVELRDDSVTVEHQPASAADQAKIEEGEIRVPVVKEELVVEKRPVVKEVLVIKRSRGSRTEEVDESVKKERIDVRDEGAAHHNPA